MDASSTSSPLVLRPRFTQGRFHRWSRVVSIVGMVGLGVQGAINVVVQGSPWFSLATLGLAAALLGGQILVSVLLTLSLSLRDGVLTARIPFRRTTVVPLMSVRRVVQIPLKSRGVTSGLYRRITVLVADDGRALFTIAERNYRPEPLATLLATLPPAEQEENPRTLRDIWKSFKPAAPLSIRDVTLMSAGYVLVLGGLAALFVGFAIHEGNLR